MPKPPGDLLPFAEPARGPLADRMRPRHFDEVRGQEHLTAPGAAFRAMVDNGRLGSAILWGPPGTGKTTLARLVASRMGLRFVPFSAVLAGIKEVREVMEQAVRDHRLHGQRTLVFIDEIHRFNKAQQDAFLPRVESGEVVLLGATTENPSFEVNAALLSRCIVFVLRPLAATALTALLAEVLSDGDRGLGGERVAIDDGLLADIAALADGDARRALTALDTLVQAATPGANDMRNITREFAAATLAKRLAHDQRGELHFDLASALIKSVRNSDPDAAVYWLARLIEAGENPRFIARRLVILAAEDVGLADPNALVVAVAAQQGSDFVGLPEARLLLTEATLYLALAAKSNSALRAYEAAKADVLGRAVEPVPLHLRNAATGLMKSLGFGHGYRYAHDDGGAEHMPCLPEGLAGKRYYEPGTNGAEPGLARRDGDDGPGSPPSPGAARR